MGHLEGIQDARFLKVKIIDALIKKILISRDRATGSD